MKESDGKCGDCGCVEEWSADRRAYLNGLVRNVQDFPKPGILFKDITPLLADVRGMNIVVDAMVERFISEGIDAVVGIESRGFIFAPMIAMRIGAGFVPVRKPGKLPWQVDTEAYELEYGTNEIQMHKDALRKGAKVLIVDDLLATGGTAQAAGRLVNKQGAKVAGYGFLVELTFLQGRAKLAGVPVMSLLSYGAGE